MKLQTLEWMRSNSIIFLCGALTFLYIVELSLGIRIVCFACEQWKRSKASESYSNNVGWNIGITSILIAVLAAGSVNMLSVYWEHRKKDTNESLSRVRITSHVLHALIGGILWRYIALWRAEDVKKEAVLLTSAKFLFTQFYTIPLLIIHVSVSTDLNGAVFDLALITSATATIRLSCIVFKDEPEVQERGSFCETMVLVPLIFRQPPRTPNEEQKEDEENPTAHPNNKKKTWAISLLRIVVSIQIFFFSYGRLLALGFLLKLAGIYAGTVLFLQILISALYLKFQAPYLFAETQLKHKQLMRLAFLSYVLVFEWHLHREKDTGYNLGTKVRQGLLYYCTTTIESAFYITVWAVTDGDQVSNEQYQEDTAHSYQTKSVVLLVGFLSLMISAAIHILLALLRSYRKLKVFSRIRQMRDVTFDAVRRRLSKTTAQQSSVKVNPASFVDIASFSESPVRCEIIIPKLDAGHSAKFCDNGVSNSYCDFKDRIDDHVHIDPKESICNSETSQKDTNPNSAGRRNDDSLTRNPFTAEAKTSREHRTAISRGVKVKVVVKDEVRRPVSPSDKLTAAGNEASDKPYSTPKHVGAITRLWEKYSKLSAKRFCKLGDRFRNLGTTAKVANEKHETPSSNSPEKDHPNVRGERATKTAVDTASKTEILHKSPANLKQSFDVQKVKQTCQKIKKVTRKFNLSPETCRAAWKKENARNVSHAPEKTAAGRSSTNLPVHKVLSNHKKSSVSGTKPYYDQNRKNNRGSEDEEDDIFVKVSIPKILITPVQSVTIDETLRTDCAKETEEIKPVRSNRKQKGDNEPPKKENQ